MKKKENYISFLPPDLFEAQALVYEPLSLAVNHLVKEIESQDYGAFEFHLNQQRVKFRVAKITPTKIGQFVTLWKRKGSGPIQPIDMADPFDLFIISVRNAQQLGQFIFPKTVLGEKGILSKNGKGGKRAMRVYPAWDIAQNQQAKKTQAWQLQYFFEIPEKGYSKADMQICFNNKSHPLSFIKESSFPNS